MGQESAELVAQVLEAQSYPDLREYPDGPPEQPYDAAGWTLPYQMGVRVVVAGAPLDDEVRGAIEMLQTEPVVWSDESVGGPEHEPTRDAAVFDSVPGVGFDTDPVAAAIVPPPGRLTGSGAAVAVDPAQNNAFRAVNRTWAGGGKVRFVGGAEPRYLLTGLSAEAQDNMVEELALAAERSAVAGVELARPRVGLYRSWTASMDEGWTRWVLERYEFEFEALYDADVRAGQLRERYEVIVLPDMRPRSIVEGHATGTMPARYVGGVGAVGVRALAEFVRQGGTLVCLNSSAAFAIEELGLDVEDVVGELERQEFFAGISILDVETSVHPVMAGMPEHAAITASRSPVWRLPEDSEASVLMRYPASGVPLLSGYLLGEEHLHGNAAALSVPHGEGRVVMFGFRPQWRGQPFGMFRVLFNALLVGGMDAQ
jgi:ribosomal protein S18 acetylase RimI-like enzyme